ncbi:HAD family hydrolase [Limnohabitans sp. 15K]|uniref:HAD family hydrolase n=1 Tax=Limnohabitans sp. 15K TaxID=1100706 RepID=UPI000C1E89C2|nr:HAD-IA family hydrolase [Limnohabitans sp. 15K]PIT81785.1 HAD family hydrolase [Limnohabitans sp. 15K]
MSAASGKALVLDFGGVISRTLFETHDLSEAALGLPPGTLTWRGPFDPETDALWQAMQADHITEREYWMARTRSVGDLVGEEWNDMKTFVQRARGADVEAVIRPEAVAAVHQAKAAGCKLAVLSNELDLFYGASFRERLPLLELFDVIIDATYTGILKPDRRAYEMCTEALDVVAADCVFVDDQSRNVLGAMRLGWQTVQFDVMNPEDSYQRALKLLGI